jgi:hypothetical protein
VGAGVTVAAALSEGHGLAVACASGGLAFPVLPPPAQPAIPPDTINAVNPYAVETTTRFQVPERKPGMRRIREVPGLCGG